VYFASTTSPYREKQAAATVAATLDGETRVRTADFADSLRAGTSALLAGLDAVRAGASSILVCAGECRMGEPGTAAEQNYGDAGAAVLLGTGSTVAEAIATTSLSDEFLGTWRREDQAFPHSFPGAFELKHGYVRLMAQALRAALDEAGLAPAQVDRLVLAGPNPRAVATAAAQVGVDVAHVLADTFWDVIGDTGAAQPLLLLASALERAKPGEILVLGSYGDGADAVVFQVEPALERYRVAHSIYRQIEAKRLLPSYGRYARFRKLVRKETPEEDLSSPVILFRDRKEVLPLYGGRCPRCGTVQFPNRVACIECGCRDGLERRRLARRGTIYTYTLDHLFEAAESPVALAVVELEGGGRVYVQVTDCEPGQVEIGMPVELTFRKYHEGSGINNYFWKARPLRGA